MGCRVEETWAAAESANDCTLKCIRTLCISFGAYKRCTPPGGRYGGWSAAMIALPLLVREQGLPLYRAGQSGLRGCVQRPIQA